jgi:thiol-disulfide isomerase/thioredoxin
MTKTNKLLVLFFILIFASSFGSKIKKRKQNIKDQIQTISSETDKKNMSALANITLKTINKGDLVFEKYKDKIIILDFWATWCPPCRAEIPHFNQLQREHSDKVQVIGISLDRDQNTVKEFIDKNEIIYPIAMSIEEFEEIFGKIYNVPTTFILNKNLSVYEKAVGYKDYDFFLNAINTISNTN